RSTCAGSPSIANSSFCKWVVTFRADSSNFRFSSSVPKRFSTSPAIGTVRFMEYAKAERPSLAVTPTALQRIERASRGQATPPPGSGVICPHGLVAASKEWAAKCSRISKGQLRLLAKKSLKVIFVFLLRLRYSGNSEQLSQLSA